ncbi:hypothetical protein HanXRQr2_Chr06g0248361 [Helianthus annuus]|uniref:Uncharacterized protein n=1 Tax=Helianthus annuus TaxID=4232 RepID=A0A9K3IQW4_HELAN|nr:hypothetical protein HanXRQr2_Chr06g0248361 [Helianthus annuus]
MGSILRPILPSSQNVSFETKRTSSPARFRRLLLSFISCWLFSLLPLYLS